MARKIKYWVPVRYEVTGGMYIKAKSRKEAIERAEDKWTRMGSHSIELPSTEVDIACDGDVDEVYKVEDE